MRQAQIRSPQPADALRPVPPDAGRPEPSPLLLNVTEAASRLGISRSLLYELLATGDIESVHVGRLRRITPTALAAYVERLTA